MSVQGTTAGWKGRAARWRWLRPSPTVRITMGLVSLLLGLLMVLDLVFKVLPDQRAMTQNLREQVSIHLAFQVRHFMQDAALTAQLQPLLQGVATQSDDIESIGLRQSDGQLVVSTPGHDGRWKATALGLSTITHVIVPLNTGSGRWGQLEVVFRSPWPDSLLGWLRHPTVMLVALLSGGAFLAFFLYLRRVLQHLDPSKAIPERVRVAFDTLTEGLLVLDVQGQILLANSAFRAFHPQAGQVLLGRSITQMAWLVQGLREAEASAPPWERVLRTSEPIMGVQVDLGVHRGEPRRALLNCAAIRDASGTPRGVLVTLDDITELDRVNARLRLTMSELEVSRDRIQQQNEELQKLANCDPMTGCLNRRAFFHQAEALMAQARAQGTPLSCFMTDIDKFKNFNDTHGHAVGDLVIEQVSRLLKGAMRPQDVLCRYGGEEFCVLLPGLDLAQAADVAERIREAIESQAGVSIEAVKGLRITSSFGVAQLNVGTATDLLPLIDRADQGLYAAKEAGRNQVQSMDWAAADVLEG